VSIIGAGRVGTALAVLLEQAGHRIVAASGRHASRDRVERHLPSTPFLPETDAAGRGAVVVIAVPDDAILPTCERLAAAGSLRPGQRVIHVSGSTSLAALDAARAAGASVLSLHPLQSFPDVESGIDRLPGSGVAVTAPDGAGFAFGQELARDLGGIPFRLADEVKPLYHAAAVFCANYLVTVEGIAQLAMAAAGVEDALALFEPLARTAFDRTFALGPGAALTGPAVRGDVGTIERNLAALAAAVPEAVEAYAALAVAAARIAEEAGRLAPDARGRVEEAVDRWR